jgi:hypothetical protein
MGLGQLEVHPGPVDQPWQRRRGRDDLTGKRMHQIVGSLVTA